MKARIVPALLLLILSLGLFASAACSGEDSGQSANPEQTVSTNSGEGKASSANSANNDKEKGRGKDADKDNDKAESTPTPKSDDSNKDELNKRVLKLEGDLNALKQKVDGLPTQPGTSSGILGFWLPLAAGILSLLGLGALGYYVKGWKGRMNLTEKRYDALSASVEKTRESIATNKDLTDRLETNLRDLNKWREDTVIELDTLDSSHLKLVDELRQKELNASGGTVPAAALAPPPVAPDNLDAPFSFPGPMGEYLKYLRRKGVSIVEAAVDPVRGTNLVDKPEGEFLRVQDNNNYERAYPVVPTLTRFSISQEFSVYQKYFHCDNLSSGDVWIREPAYVVEDSVAGGWKLKEMGRLEVK